MGTRAVAVPRLSRADRLGYRRLSQPNGGRAPVSRMSAELVCARSDRPGDQAIQTHLMGNLGISDFGYTPAPGIGGRSRRPR